MAAAEADIREALTLYLEEKLEAVKAGLTTERRFRYLRGMTKQRREKVMGADLYYLEVIPVTDISMGDPDPSGQYRTRQYPYTATLYHLYEDADTYAASSQATWDPILQAMVEALAAGSFLPTAPGYAGTHTGRIEIVEPPTIVLDIAPMGGADDQACHVAQATLRLSDQS